MPTKTQSPMSKVRAFMEDYARRGVFRGFSSRPASDGIAAFRMIWHQGRSFDLIVDTWKQTIFMPEVLPRVPPSLYTDFKTFVESHHAPGLPDHRRIDTAKARVRSANRRGSVSLRMVLKTGDYEYGLQRFIHLVHETYLIFLSNGTYRDYLAEQLGVSFDIG